MFGETRRLREDIREERKATQSWIMQASTERARADQLSVENIRMRADLDWFKLRLNAVEKERQQLIQAAIGVKIPIPEFTPIMEDPQEALNQGMPDLSCIGADAPDGFNPESMLANTQPNYDGLPARANN